MRIYISGKITGLPWEEALKKFQEAEDYLNGKYGYLQVEPINPTKIKQIPEATWAQCMKEDIGELLNCDGIFMLKGWGESKGARIEHGIARELKLVVEYQS